MPAETTPATMSVKDAATYLGVSRATLYRLTALDGAGALPVVRLGRSVRFLRSDLDDYINRNRSGQVRTAKHVSRTPSVPAA